MERINNKPRGDWKPLDSAKLMILSGITLDTTAARVAAGEAMARLAPLYGVPTSTLHERLRNSGRADGWVLT